MKKKKNRLYTILIGLMFLAGLSLLLYPTVSNYWNSLHQARAIATYSDEVAQLSGEDYTEMLEAAEAYNESLVGSYGRFNLSEDEEELYNSLINIGGTGIMGYVEIPVIKCSLPIYHGTDENVLQIAIGHIPGSSLPIGGESTHSVLSGHRGLPSAKLFTNLDKLKYGDRFMIRILNETLTYEVDQILTVEPDQLDALEIVEGEDYCTLVTCTPYGINTHRLLVRGHRVDNSDLSGEALVTADALQIDPVMIAPILASPVIAITVVVVVIDILRKRKK